jgi:hypothetical protein
MWVLLLLVDQVVAVLDQGHLILALLELLVKVTLVAIIILLILIRLAVVVVLVLLEQMALVVNAVLVALVQHLLFQEVQ